MNGVKQMKNKKNNYKELHVNIGQLISARELEDLERVKTNLQRKINRKERRENKEKHNGR